MYENLDPRIAFFKISPETNNLSCSSIKILMTYYFHSFANISIVSFYHDITSLLFD